MRYWGEVGGDNNKRGVKGNLVRLGFVLGWWEGFMMVRGEGVREDGLKGKKGRGGEGYFFMVCLLGWWRIGMGLGLGMGMGMEMG